MKRLDIGYILERVEKINSNCLTIQTVLNEHVESTSDEYYKKAGSADIVTLGNLINIMQTVTQDIEAGNLSECMELVLRIAANDFQEKIRSIPEKRTLKNEIIACLHEIHRHVFHALHSRNETFFERCRKAITDFFK